VLQEYQRRLKAHIEAIQNACRRIGATYVQLRNDRAPQDVIMRDLYPQGVVSL
jgi:hypothetical protein